VWNDAVSVAAARASAAATAAAAAAGSAGGGCVVMQELCRCQLSRCTKFCRWLCDGLMWRRL
jgi:hypothetical protein